MTSKGNMLLWFVLFISSVDGFLVESGLKVNITLCKDIAKTFLSGQESVTVFNANRLRENYPNGVLKAIEAILPLLIYDEVDEVLVTKIHDMGDELNLPSMSKSYMVFSESTDWIALKLNLFSRINTNGKWIFFMSHIEKREAEILLKKAFEKHKMLNILTIYVDKQLRIFTASYNPFKLDNQGKRGKMWSREVKIENLSKVLEKVDKVFEKKVGDLQGFELKVSTFYEPSKISDFLNEPMPDLVEKALNCKLKFVRTEDGNFGTRLANGSFSGQF